MIPNKTEEQILIQYFKYYDLEGSGFCNLRNFIKSHERLGVVLSKIKDIEEIFNEFDVNKTGIINYKTFAHNIFTPEHKEQTPETIADMFGLTKERVRQIIKISIEKIQHIKINKFK